MQQLSDDIDQLEETLRKLFGYLKRPHHWQHISSLAKVNVDRPSASIIHLIVNSKEQKRTVNELAELIGVEAPSISRKVQELELQGLVKKVRSVTDRRAMYIQATAKAVKVDDHIKKARRSMAEKALSDWSDKDRKLLVELMDRYVEDLIKQ